jgi:peptidoglycan/xylan/chitin deacetylase (PgdA/CDA1 family)
MSWSQLGALAAAGDEIGGKTVDGGDLTRLSASQATTEICSDRQTIMAHGITPASFAYPRGAFTAATQAQVRSCGYSNARGASGGFGSGGTYAETLPPADWLGLRAYAPAGRVTLAGLQSVVTRAAGQAGGWVPVVLQSVCSRTADASSWARCTGVAGWIDLADLRAFIAWVRHSGRPGGAPSETLFQTVSAAAAGVATAPPSTTVTCNGAPCRPAAYSGAVTVSLAATALGPGVGSIHYTTTGAEPTLSSPTFRQPFVVARTVTIAYRSWALGGAAEQVHRVSIHVLPPRLVVSLTFDDAYADQWLYLRPLLRAHHMNATYYVITGDSDAPFACCMSFAQLRALEADGDDVGGHGVAHVKLTDPTVAEASKVADVCESRADLIAHGISDPVSYAYPFGSFNAAGEGIVAACGYKNSREGGDASTSTTVPGAPWAESIPPRDAFALRPVDVDAPAAKKLADLETFVNAAAAHGGRWLLLTFHNVCHAGAADYARCMASWSAVDDRMLARFLDWLAGSGREGGAPAGTTVETVREVMVTAAAAK